MNNLAWMDRLRAMKTFVRVVKAGSFRNAAAELGASRAAVTKHIQDLEQSLGAELLRRTTRRLALTEVGESYFNLCTRLIADLDEAEASIRDSQTDPMGHLRLLVPRAFGAGSFAAFLAEFIRSHPGLEVTMLLSDSASHSFGGVDGDVDIAIRLWEIPADSAVVARRVGWMRWATCAAPAYIKEAGRPQSIEDLSSHNCLLHPRLAPDRIWRFTNGQSVKVSGRFSAASVQAIRQAAIAGVGIAQLPLYFVKADLESGLLEPLLAAYDIRQRPVYAVIPNARFAPRRVRTFLRFFSRWCDDQL
ncbi:MULTISPECIES: LysR family transcriptional regulator [unclassified Beijerinckia]|uniref:LysR family transcriptional regulator n=1 Tax=unclassified Beijerinckia TaxID=2638183 RepID=UPI00147F95C7|nr:MULTISPECIES: LysR family transcriptional regulator [unclassified Beijerinckia]